MESITLTRAAYVGMIRFEIILAAVLLVADIALIISKKGKSTKKEKLLYGILGAIVGLLVSDVIIYHSYGNLSQVYHYVEIVSNLIYYTCDYLVAWMIVKYAFELIKINGGVVSHKLDIISDIAIIFAEFTLLINLFTDRIYFIDGNNVYQRGDLFILSLIPIVVIMGILFISVFKYSKYLSKIEKCIVLSYVVLPLIAEGIQVIQSGFSWQPLSMAVTACIILIQGVFSKTKERNILNDTYINQEGKAWQTRIILFVCIIITAFFGLIAKIAIGFASNQMNKEIEAHYQMLSNKTTEQASAWIVKETQILINQKASLEIINNFDKDFLTEYFTCIDTNYNYDNYFFDMYFLTPKNVMSCGSGYIQEPEIDFRERGWYKNALGSDNVCYTAPYVDADSGKYIVTVSTRVFDKSRKFVGVLALDIFVDKLFAVTEQEDLPKDSYLFMLDNNLALVTHPNTEFGYVNDEPQNMRDVGSDQYNELADFIKTEGTAGKYMTFTDYDGISRCFFVSKVDGCDWYVVAAISQSVIDQSRQNLNESIFIALIVCLVLGIIITLWLTNNIIKKLSEAQEEANAASEAKSRFLANMSHEIRTPINAVLGMDEMLLRECEDEHLKEYARNIQSAGQALLGVVNDILDFSKIESDKLDLVPGTYETGELIGSCINLIKLRVDDKGLQFEVNREDYIPKKLHGDEVRIRQIISNLLTNAVKYTKAGKVTLNIGWKKTDDKHGELIIKVADTGIGIKKENIGDLFASFQRFDEKKNRNIEGTGLGLAITKRLVNLMGGDINVESEYGKGSEFSVNIPQKVIDGENVESFKVASADAEKEKIVLKTKDTKILVVDDVPMNLKVVKGLLKGTDITVDTATRGAEAIEKICETKYDVIFLDHMMPEMDGIETLKALNENHKDKLGDTPVIMLTANAILGVEDMYKKEGFKGYLSKPVDRELLYKCLIEWIPDGKVL